MTSYRSRDQPPASDTLSGMAPKKPARYVDLREIPDTLVAEIVEGELVVSPRPAIPHAVAASGLNGDLNGPFQRGRGGPGGWWILSEPELHLGADVLVPDLAGWRRERMAAPPNAPAIELPPDWICEVTSPRTGALDRVRKMRLYARAGVQHAWLLDPLQRTLEVFRLERGAWLAVQAWMGNERVRAEPFDAIELELEALWLPEPAAAP